MYLFSLSKELADYFYYSIAHKVAGQKSTINTLALEYDNVYSSIAEGSDKRVKHKINLKPTSHLPKNVSEIRIKQKYTPMRVNKAKMPNLKIQYPDGANYEESIGYNQSKLEENRSNSLVIISKNDHLKSVSRPKQRHPKLLDDRGRMNSILKMLEKSHKVNLPNQRNTDSKKQIPKILAASEDHGFDGRSSERSKGVRSEKSVQGLSSINTSSIHKSKLPIDKPKYAQSVIRKHSVPRHGKVSLSMLPDRHNIRDILNNK